MSVYCMNVLYKLEFRNTVTFYKNSFQFLDWDNLNYAPLTMWNDKWEDKKKARYYWSGSVYMYFYIHVLVFACMPCYSACCNVFVYIFSWAILAYYINKLSIYVFWSDRRTYNAKVGTAVWNPYTQNGEVMAPDWDFFVGATNQVLIDRMPSPVRLSMSLTRNMTERARFFQSPDLTQLDVFVVVCYLTSTVNLYGHCWAVKANQLWQLVRL